MSEFFAIRIQIENQITIQTVKIKSDLTLFPDYICKNFISLELTKIYFFN